MWSSLPPLPIVDFVVTTFLGAMQERSCLYSPLCLGSTPCFPGLTAVLLLFVELQPSAFLLACRISNTLGQGELTRDPQFQKDINQVCLYFVYLAIVAGVVSYFEVSSC